MSTPEEIIIVTLDEGIATVWHNESGCEVKVFDVTGLNEYAEDIEHQAFYELIGRFEFDAAEKLLDRVDDEAWSEED